MKVSVGIRRLLGLAILVALVLPIFVVACASNQNGTNHLSSDNKEAQELPQSRPPKPPPDMSTLQTRDTSPPINPGIVQFYVTATPPPEEVTSVMLTIRRIRLRRPMPGREEVSMPEYVNISDNIYTFDLVQISRVEQFLGNSEASSGDYTEVEYWVESVEMSLEGGELQAVQLPVLHQAHGNQIIRPFGAGPPFEVTQGRSTTLVISFNCDYYYYRACLIVR